LLKEELRLMIDSDEARLVSENTFELMDYLRCVDGKTGLKKATAADKCSFAYHSPCHLSAIDAAGASVEILNKIDGVTVIDVSSGCCGLAGTCGMQKKNYDLSVQFGKSMQTAIERCAAEQAMTECGACKMQIEQLTNKQVVHPVKILASAYGLIE
jgi:Fe-S oxidoreductase